MSCQPFLLIFPNYNFVTAIFLCLVVSDLEKVTYLLLVFPSIFCKADCPYRDRTRQHIPLVNCGCYWKLVLCTSLIQTCKLILTIVISLCIVYVATVESSPVKKLIVAHALILRQQNSNYEVRKEITTMNKLIQVFSKVWLGLKGYLTDWRNLLGHASLGVLLLVLAIWAPVQIWFKLVTIACLITLNIIRMRRKARKAEIQTTEEASDELVSRSDPHPDQL